MIRGHFLEAEGCCGRFKIEERFTANTLIEQKTSGPENEGAMEIQRASENLRQIHENGSYYFRSLSRLPSLKGIRKALSAGMSCVFPIDFGSDRPEVPPEHVLPLLLERLPGQQAVRVIVLGPNYIDASLVYDITNIEEYTLGLRRWLESTSEERAVNCLEYLLE